MDERLDKFSILFHLQRLLPQASDDLRKGVVHRLITETRSWSRTRSRIEFNTRAILRLEALCREARDGSLPLREAAEKGYDRLAWTTGEQQAERYDLSKQIESAMYSPEDGAVSIVPKDGETYQTIATGVEPEELPDYVGKDAAHKLLKATPNPKGELFINGLDLKIGGEWAEALYDRALVNFLNRYAKKWGAKVGETTLKGTDRSDKAGRSYAPPQKVHSIDITPAMKKSVLEEGQPIAENAPMFDWASTITKAAQSPRSIENYS